MADLDFTKDEAPPDTSVNVLVPPETTGDVGQISTDVSAPETPDAADSYRPPHTPYQKFDKNAQHEDSLVLHIRGFPFETTEEEILEFLEVPVDELEEHAVVTGLTGRPCGEMFVHCKEMETREKILEKAKSVYKDTSRYIDVFKTGAGYFAKRVNITNQFCHTFDGIVRINGLPYVDNVEELIAPLLENLPVRKNGIHMPCNPKSGKSIGEGYVAFKKFTDASEFIGLSGSSLEDGSIVVMRESSNNELRSALFAVEKLKYHSKWSDASIKVGQQPRALGEKTTASAIAMDIGGDACEHPEAKRPKSEADSGEQQTEQKERKPSGGCPYNHLIRMADVVIDGLKTSHIQKFFKPHKAIAVNIKTAEATVDVAFKTHLAASAAMEKTGEEVNGGVPTLTLNSEAE